MTARKRERRDWTLLIFIIPIGILLILIVGHLGAKMMPFWRIKADMRSNLEPNPDSARPFALLEPILPQILTPFAWLDTYLTPGADISFPPFLTFEPTATPSPTAATPSSTADTPAPTATTPAPTETVTPVTVTGTPPSPTDTEDPPTDPPPSATTVSPSPTTPPPSPTTPSPSPTTPSPSPTTPSPSPTTPSPSPTTPAPTGITSTIPPSYGTPVTPVPTDIGVGTLPDGNIGTITAGTYIVINLSVVVSATPDDNYDLVFYEYDNGGSLFLDWIIIGISNDPTGASYYEVFNWGNDIPDSNSNADYTDLPADPVNCPSDGECDNREIPISGSAEVPPSENILYDPDYVPANPPSTSESNGPAPQTGILIDVDTASSSPPPNTYNYIVIISPGGGGDAAQVDAVQTVEVPTPTPP